MNIVLEGPDGSGKSTLASYLAIILNMRLIPGRGPVRPGTELMRFNEHRSIDNAIFDRHVCVSEPLYGPLFQRQKYGEALYRHIYDGNHIFIYCQAPAGSLVGHVASSPTDTAEYLEQLDTHFAQVVQRYEAWASRHAHFIYRRNSRNPAIAAFINDLAGTHNDYMHWKCV